MLSLYFDAARGRGGMGDGWILPTSIDSVLADHQVTDPDIASQCRRLIRAIDSSVMQRKTKKADQERRQREAEAAAAKLRSARR